VTRREFITLLGSAAAWPLAARAQQGERVRRIGVLMNGRSTETVPQALRQPGWTEGQKSAR
jgi:putative ABC transport system substrate-binding protein